MTRVVQPRVAIDSCVFINVLCEGADPGDTSRHPHSLRLFEAAEAGELEVFVSAIVPAEVLGSPRIRGTDAHRAEMRRRRHMAREWLTAGEFNLVEVDRTIVERAADLSHQHHLKGADAVVLATAAETDCETLYTWDSGLLNVQSVPSLAVATPEAFSGGEDLFSTSIRRPYPTEA